MIFRTLKEMAKNPLTLSQAKILWAEFQTLRGMPFREGAATPISHVVIAPYDEINQFIFVSFLDKENFEETLKSYGGCLYSILVMAKSTAENEIWLFRDLLDYLEEQKTPLDPKIFAITDETDNPDDRSLPAAN